MLITKLSALQRDVLRSFFAREHRFFLSGGGALVGFHLGHRETEDLDLFVLQDVLAEGARTLAHVAQELSASLEIVTDSSDFKRFVIRRGMETLKVDLVHETATQQFKDKLEIDGIRVDPPLEILSNKLCTLLSRGEIRDLVDVFVLEQAGYRMEDALGAAMQKDRGLTPAQLAAILDEWTIGPEARLPGSVDPKRLDEYRHDLIARLTRLAFPIQ